MDELEAFLIQYGLSPEQARSYAQMLLSQGDPFLGNAPELADAKKGVDYEKAFNSLMADNVSAARAGIPGYGGDELAQKAFAPTVEREYIDAPKYLNLVSYLNNSPEGSVDWWVANQVAKGFSPTDIEIQANKLMTEKQTDPRLEKVYDSLKNMTVRDDYGDPIEGAYNLSGITDLATQLAEERAYLPPGAVTETADGKIKTTLPEYNYEPESGRYFVESEKPSEQAQWYLDRGLPTPDQQFTIGDFSPEAAAYEDQAKQLRLDALSQAVPLGVTRAQTQEAYNRLLSSKVNDLRGGMFDWGAAPAEAGPAGAGPAMPGPGGVSGGVRGGGISGVSSLSGLLPGLRGAGGGVGGGGAGGASGSWGDDELAARRPAPQVRGARAGMEPDRRPPVPDLSSMGNWKDSPYFGQWRGEAPPPAPPSLTAGWPGGNGAQVPAMLQREDEESSGSGGLGFSTLGMTSLLGGLGGALGDAGGWIDDNILTTKGWNDPSAYLRWGENFNDTVANEVKGWNDIGAFDGFKAVPRWFGGGGDDREPPSSTSSAGKSDPIPEGRNRDLAYRMLLGRQSDQAVKYHQTRNAADEAAQRAQGKRRRWEDPAEARRIAQSLLEFQLAKKAGQTPLTRALQSRAQASALMGY